MNELSLKIAIAEPSAIIRSGLSVVLKRIPGIHLQTFEISSIDLLLNYLRIQKPNLLIVNPVSWGVIDLQKLREDSGHSQLKCYALISSMVDESIISQYDNKISIYDGLEVLKNKLNKILDKTIILPDDTGNLSNREKEILTCVVKGQTNKEIAEGLFLSTHTVITHRRNIARKLEIHSTAGLTIYAIVNKLVELDDI